MLRMRTYEARLTEISMQAEGQVTAWIECPRAAIPSAGQYVFAYVPGDPLAVMGYPLYPTEACGLKSDAGSGFWASPPVPPAWAPGAALALRGPLGRGFRLHGQRLALAALGDTVHRLLPLAGEALRSGDAVTLFTGSPLPALPAAIEIYPLSSLPEALAWADFLAVDLPTEALPSLRSRLGLEKGDRLPITAQALMYLPIPCGGLAECGACAVPGRDGRKYALACKDGPVFPLDELDW
jgi:NAD(P)H-flavin reductase